MRMQMLFLLALGTPSKLTTARLRYAHASPPAPPLRILQGTATTYYEAFTEIHPERRTWRFICYLKWATGNAKQIGYSAISLISRIMHEERWTVFWEISSKEQCKRDSVLPLLQDSSTNSTAFQNTMEIYNFHTVFPNSVARLFQFIVSSFVDRIMQILKNIEPKTIFSCLETIKI